MPTTSGGLPYPAYSDSPDVPGHIHALATAVDSTKATATHSHAESDVTSLVTDLAGKAASGHTHTLLPNRQVIVGKVTATCDTSGYITVTHGGPSTPIGCIAAVETASNYIAVCLTRTATTFRIRVFDADTGGTAAGMAFSATWIAVF